MIKSATWPSVAFPKKIFWSVTDIDPQGKIVQHKTKDGRIRDRTEAGWVDEQPLAEDQIRHFSEMWEDDTDE